MQHEEEGEDEEQVGEEQLSLLIVYFQIKCILFRTFSSIQIPKSTFLTHFKKPCSMQNRISQNLDSKSSQHTSPHQDEIKKYKFSARSQTDTEHQEKEDINISPLKSRADTLNSYNSPFPNSKRLSESQTKSGCSLSNSSGKIERDRISIIDKVKVKIQGWNNFNIFRTNRKKCKCQSSLDEDNFTCPKAMTWLLSYYSQEDIPKLKSDYELLKGDVDRLYQKDQIIQIEKDITRTYGLSEFLDKNILKRILLVWSIFDPNIGYVQGMNLIVGSLLYHAEEFIVFYLFEMLIGRFEMRDIYQIVYLLINNRNSWILEAQLNDIQARGVLSSKIALIICKIFY